jgi:hypothetical protein
VSTDIGGTDPDDNQSMIHLLMYNELFDIEGLVSSPSYGDGTKQEILRTIDLYEKDLPKLRKHKPELSSPDYLRSVVNKDDMALPRSRDMLPQQKVRTGLLNAHRKK